MSEIFYNKCLSFNCPPKITWIYFPEVSYEIETFLGLVQKTARTFHVPSAPLPLLSLSKNFRVYAEAVKYN